MSNLKTYETEEGQFIVDLKHGGLVNTIADFTRLIQDEQSQKQPSQILQPKLLPEVEYLVKQEMKRFSELRNKQLSEVKNHNNK